MATITRYINTDSTAGGDGTTNATSGDNRAYATMDEWDTAESTDLVTAGDIHVVNISAPSGTADSTTTRTSLAAWVTGASNYIELIGDRTNEVNFDTGIYIRIRTSGSSSGVFNPDNYTRIRNLQFSAQLAGSDAVVKNIVDGTVDIRYERCYFKYDSVSGVSNRVFYLEDSDAGTIYVWNCIFDGGGATTTAWVIRSTSSFAGATLEMRSCVVTNGGTGLAEDGGTFNVKNCAVFNNTDDFGAGFAGTRDYCASDDGDGTNSIDISPGATEADDWNDAFTNYSTGDFRVKDASSVLYNAGLDTSGESAPLNFTNDFIDTSRPQAGTWDVAAFEFIAAAAGIEIFRRRIEGYKNN